MVYIDNPGNKLNQQTLNLMALNHEGYSYTHRNVSSQKIANAVLRLEGVRNLGMLIGKAIDAKENALSYRDFRVGAAALAAFYPSNDREMWRYGIITGANAKPEPNDTINVHAEHTVMTTAKTLKKPNDSLSIPLLVIAGDLQPDQQSGVASPTLHPCGVCREAFCEADSPVSDDTLIVTIDPDYREYQWFTSAELRAFYNNPGGHLPGHTKFDETPLFINEIGPDPTTGALNLSVFEDQKYIESDREVNEKLIRPLFTKAMLLYNTINQ